MKVYQSKSSVRKKVNQTLLKYVDYIIIAVDGGFTAKFDCLSELEKKTVLREGFTF